MHDRAITFISEPVLSLLMPATRARLDTVQNFGVLVACTISGTSADDEGRYERFYKCAEHFCFVFELINLLNRYAFS